MAEDRMATRVDQLPNPPRLDPQVSTSGVYLGPGNSASIPNARGASMPAEMQEMNNGRVLPMMQTQKDRAPVAQINYQDVMQRSYDTVQQQQQQQQNMMQHQYSPYEHGYFPPHQQQQPTFWSENRYALIVFALCFVSMYAVMPRISALIPGKDNLWLSVGILAILDAWLFQIGVKYF